MYLIRCTRVQAQTVRVEAINETQVAAFALYKSTSTEDGWEDVSSSEEVLSVEPVPPRGFPRKSEPNA